MGRGKLDDMLQRETETTVSTNFLRYKFFSSLVGSGQWPKKSSERLLTPYRRHPFIKQSCLSSEVKPLRCLFCFALA